MGHLLWTYCIEPRSVSEPVSHHHSGKEECFEFPCLTRSHRRRGHSQDYHPFDPKNDLDHSPGGVQSCRLRELVPSSSVRE